MHVREREAVDCFLVFARLFCFPVHRGGRVTILNKFCYTDVMSELEGKKEAV